MARERLHGSLSTVEYFTFGFGTMIGVGWVVLMDDWLSRGGPGGGMLGFLIGTSVLHIFGMIIGEVASMQKWLRRGLRFTGGAVTASGVAFLLQTLGGTV